MRNAPKQHDENPHVRGRNRYSPEQKRRILKLYQREQKRDRVEPGSLMRRGNEVDLKTLNPPPERKGPEVISSYFSKKILAQRDTDFWKKPWGKKKVDLPLPSYLRDFKDCDTYLLVPHFAHCRRNVGISKNAAASEAMMRSLSAPLDLPGLKPETNIYGNYSVGPSNTGQQGRTPMVRMPPRTPLENTIRMNARAEADFAMTHNGATSSKIKKEKDPARMNFFIDELTEAYALCSAHEQLTEEIEAIRGKAKHKAGVTLPKLPSASEATKPVDFLQTLLSKSKMGNSARARSVMNL